MVEINSSAILAEPMKRRADKDMIAAYDKLVNRLKQAGITPKKHVLNNKVPERIKNHIRDHYRYKTTMVPPRYHR